MEEERKPSVPSASDGGVTRSGRSIPVEERRYQLNMKLGGLYSLSGRFEDKNKKLPPEFEERTAPLEQYLVIGHYVRIPVALRL